MLRDLHAVAFVGATIAERRLAQALRIDVDLDVEISRARGEDDLAGTVDYAALRAAIVSVVAASPAALLEHLGERLLEAIVRLPGMIFARIRLAKPGLFAGATPVVEVAGQPYRLVALGLGANLGDAPAVLASTRDALKRFGRVTACSSLYRTRPWGVLEQPDFYNAAVLLRTLYPVETLLAALKAIEGEFGRKPGPRFGPRAIDCDILDDGAGSHRSARLVVPHPRLNERAFALGPLAEIDPAYAPAFAALPDAERASITRLTEWPSPVADT